jgi:predicted GIY-YIG superfamily endonuclease
MTYWVYILASKPGGTLYIGVTNDLVRRVYEHREGLAESFTKRYGIKMLVYFEAHADDICGTSTREEHQTLVARVENRPDRREQPRLARSIRRDCPLVRTMDCRVKPGNDNLI